MLIFGIAALVEAGIVIVTPDGVSGSIQTDPIDVSVVPQQGMWLGITGSGTVSNTTLLYDGNLSGFTDATGELPILTDYVDSWIAEYVAVTPGFEGGPSTAIYLVELFDADIPPIRPIGQLATFDVTGEVEAYLIDMDLVTGVFSAVAIPEPTMIALLALGGIALLRKRRQG